MTREYDVIVWGSTGFTGGLVAEYFCENYGINEKVKWAIAGRNADKLQQLKTRLKTLHSEADSLECIISDSFDAESLRQMTARSKVVCTTVGPYMKYGMELISACVDTGTHYCDLTGESPFIRNVIDVFHERAKEKKVKLVHACGYDSIPSDLGVLFIQNEMLSKFQSYAQEVRMYVGPTKGGFSGGTVASMIGILEKASDKKIRRVLGSPYSLNPQDNYRGPDKGDQQSIRFDQVAKKWTAPFLMAGINTRVVRRSHALQGYEYGPPFRYSEVMGFSQGFKGWWNATKITVAMGCMVTMLIQPWIRTFLQKNILPKPGQGPNEERRKKGFFTVHFLALYDDKKLWAVVKDSLDPGYGSTAKMLAESALILALEEEVTPSVYGSVTPASALGLPLIKRLQKAGIGFEITDQK